MNRALSEPLDLADDDQIGTTTSLGFKSIPVTPSHFPEDEVAGAPPDAQVCAMHGMSNLKAGDQIFSRFHVFCVSSKS